ncbi:unnamed protein product, partial [Sphagnum balticum]
SCKTMEALCFGRDYENSKSIDEQYQILWKEQQEEFAKLNTDKGVKAFEKLRLLDLKGSNLEVVEYYVQL